ncbi:MAG: orotate phosphoribosyltransferase [Proteobacteria bacterium]|nr:orotate phosphoribosyltransferase [Pseudomonadota bacterium]
MTTEELVRARKALLEGHFQLSSGLHSDRYVQCARLFEDPRDAERLGRELAAQLGGSFDVVVSPALGGLLIGYEVARALTLPFLFTERQEGVMTMRRGFELGPGSRALIVEDVLTTGKSTGEVAAVVRSKGAVSAAAASVINRGCTEASLGMPITSLLKLPLTTYRPEDCPLCKSGKPIDKPGSRPKPQL